MKHELKTWPGPFTATWRGLKPYEIRKADRPYAVGDVLTLREWGLPDDLCVMGLGPVVRVDATARGGEVGP